MTLHHALVVVGTLATSLELATTASAHQALGSCTINFDNSVGLSKFAGNARDTFALCSGKDAGGVLKACTELPREP